MKHAARPTEKASPRLRDSFNQRPLPYIDGDRPEVKRGRQVTSQERYIIWLFALVCLFSGLRLQDYLRPYRVIPRTAPPPSRLAPFVPGSYRKSGWSHVFVMWVFYLVGIGAILVGIWEL